MSMPQILRLGSTASLEDLWIFFGKLLEGRDGAPEWLGILSYDMSSVIGWKVGQGPRMPLTV